MSRKYRQRGYQEDETSSRSRGESRERPLREGPRGRGLGAPSETAFACARCGTRILLDVVPESTCSKCGSDLHTCTNCRHFDSSAPNECRAGVEVRIAGKSKRNDCAAFEPKLVKRFAADSGARDDPKAAFDSLFDL